MLKKTILNTAVILGLASVLPLQQVQASVETLTTTEAKSALQQGKVTSKQLTKVLVSRANKLVDQNSLITINENAIEEAKASDNVRLSESGPRALEGVAIVVKDNIHVKGLPNTAGTPALQNFVPNKDNPVVKKLRDAGAIILGKTNMHELAFGITSNNATFGAVKNAYDATRSAGGSSGGTGAAIGACIVSAGLGTDTGGSARIPASVNGIVGLRPTSNRYISGGVTPISSTRDTVGPMARTVKGVALLDAVITDQAVVSSANLKGVRLGVPTQFWENLDPEVERVMKASLKKLSKAGVEFVEVDTTEIVTLNHQISFAVVLYETRLDLAAYLNNYHPDVSLTELANQIASPDVKGVFDSAIVGDKQVPQEAYEHARFVLRPQLQGAYAKLYSENHLDALVFPTIPAAPAPISGADQEVVLNGQKVPTFPTYIRNTDPGSNAGIPGITLPAGMSKTGHPVGLALDGPAWSDSHLMSLGLAIEQVLGQVPLSPLCRAKI